MIAARWLFGGIVLLVSLALFLLSFLGLLAYVSGNEIEGLSNNGIGMFGLITFLLAVPSAFVANFLIRSALSEMRSRRQS